MLHSLHLTENVYFDLTLDGKSNWIYNSRVTDLFLLHIKCILPVFSPLLKLIVGLFQYSSHYFLGILGFFFFIYEVLKCLKYSFILHLSHLILIALLQNSCLSSIMDNFDSFVLFLKNKCILLFYLFGGTRS